MINLKRKSIGFTLIELIFVVAIISVIITLGISYTSKLSERAKEKTAALQIQQILQAGMAYYVDYGWWPNNGSSTQSSDFFKNYVSSGATYSNPWFAIGSDQGEYRWGPTIAGTNQTKGLFWVSTDVTDENVANRVISLLPNAYYDDSHGGKSITAEVAIPGQTQNVSHGYVIRAGTFNVSSLEDTLCYFSPTVVANAEVNLCTANGMHVEVSSMIQSLDTTIFPSGSINFNTKILFENTCKIDDNNFGITYSVKGDKYKSTSLWWLTIYNTTSIYYTVLCLPGAGNGENKRDIEYAIEHPSPTCTPTSAGSGCNVSPPD